MYVCKIVCKKCTQYNNVCMLWFVKTCGCFPVDVNLHVGMPVCIECLNVCMHACRHACVCVHESI